MRTSYRYNGRIYEVDLRRQPDGTYRVEIDGRVLELSTEAGPEGSLLLIEAGAGRRLAHVASEGERRFVHLDGQAYALDLPDTRATRRQAAAHAGDLSAQMPGQVTAVHVQPGDEVAAGQALVTLEAMKMEMRVVAPHAGSVARVLVAPGDLVERGQTLAEVTAAAPDSP